MHIEFYMSTGVVFNFRACRGRELNTVEYRSFVGRLVSMVTLFKLTPFVSSYGAILMFSFII